MDQLRGAAILLVLVWHAPAVPALFGAVVPEPIFRANMALLPFRMPTLMLLSGLLLPVALNKPLPVYYLGKVSAIVWPYVLFVQLDRLLLGADHPWYHWRSYYATSYLWFLFFVGVFYAIAPLLRRLPVWLPVSAFATASLLLPAGTERRLTYFAVFFFLGQLLAEHPGWLERLTRGRVLVLWGVLAGGMAVASAVFERRLAYGIEYGAFSLAGVLCAIAFVRWLERRGRLLGWLNAVGRSSVVYYCAHFPVMVLTLTGLRALGVTSLVVVALVNLVVALLVCTLLVRYQQHAPVSWLFRSPRTPTRWVRRRLEAWSAGRPVVAPEPTTAAPAAPVGPREAQVPRH